MFHRSFRLVCVFATISLSILFTIPSTADAKDHPEMVSIYKNFPKTTETSGGTWDGKRLYTVDDSGFVYASDENGVILDVFDVDGADIESMTYVPERPDYIYVGVESDPENDDFPSIYEINTASGILERIFYIPSNFPMEPGHGMESLTFVPDPSNPQGGVFLCGSQATGARVFVMQLDLNDPDSEDLIELAQFTAPGGTRDLSDMTTDVKKGKLYFLFDSDKTMTQVDIAGTGILGLKKGGKVTTSVEKTWKFDTSDQEGIVFNDQFAFIGNDAGNLFRITRANLDALYLQKSSGSKDEDGSKKSKSGKKRTCSEKDERKGNC